MSKSFPIASKTVGLSAIALVGACTVCCALPLLAAAGLSGGLLTILDYVQPRADILLLGGTMISILGVMVWRARARSSAACATAGETVEGCSCPTLGTRSILSTPAPRADEPLVCTADLADKPAVRVQIDGYRSAFQHLLRVERFDNGVRWVFAKRPGLDAELRHLAENEHRCCAFFKFDLEETNDAILWETTARPEATRVLDEFAGLPQRLAAHAPGGEVLPIKQAIGDAGLIFKADARTQQ